MLTLFFIFLKVGILGFGGGYAILPMIYQDVQAFGLMTADDFSNLVALSQVTPGPIAINAATYVGYKSYGLLGALVATFAVSLPSFVLIMIAMLFLEKFRTNKVVQAILYGIKPATVGLMASAFAFMLQTAIMIDPDLSWSSLAEGNLDYLALAIASVIFILVRYTKIGAIKLTLLGGVMGIVLSLLF
ncbi:MAG: chromate transporter [Bacteroidales bacterium]|nr:chromate transporter [Bacteroidales bacterium]